MSETTSAPADAGNSGGNDTSDALANMVKELGIEDLAPDASETADKDEYRDPLADPGEPDEKITLKVNGKSIEKTKSEVIAAAQMYEATALKLDQAKKQLEQAKTMQEQVTGQQQAIRNLLGVLQRGDMDTIANFASEHLGAGEVFNKAVINYALKLYEYSKMSPEQREAVENKKLIAKFRQEAEQRSRQDQERAFEYRVNQWTDHINNEIPKAITEVGLVDSPFVRDHIVSTWRAAIERGQEPTAKAVAQYVKQRLDDAKINIAPAPAPSAPQRRTATPDSVRKSSAPSERPARGSSQGGEYMSWSDWQKSRGR